MALPPAGALVSVHHFAQPETLTNGLQSGRLPFMKDDLKELVSIAKSLPAEKTAEIVDFARFLRQQSKARHRKAAKGRVLGTAEDDAQWERILNDPRPRPKLAAMVEEVDRHRREGKIEPMDFSKFDL